MSRLELARQSHASRGTTWWCRFRQDRKERKILGLGGSGPDLWTFDT
jgi:hypothetical protein